MKAIITVLGKDTVGILAKVSSACAEENVNIIEVTQSVLQDMFAMIMLSEFDSEKVSFDEFQKKLDILGDENGLKIHVMHEDIFNSMHKI
ncbi:MAG: ACT domain-containing protein [Oscillospiraceae bacterium]|nr:ACT domain-containing protein [Candidatus Ruminococcus equi]